MDEGYIKLHRKLLNWEWFGDSDTLQLWLYLLLKASYKDCQYKGIDLKRGQLVLSLGMIEKDLRHTKRHTRTLLAYLKTTHEITIKTTHRYSIVTICNYDNYQPKGISNDTLNDTLNDTPSAQWGDKNRHTDRHTCKEIKENILSLSTGNNNNIINIGDNNSFTNVKEPLPPTFTTSLSLPSDKDSSTAVDPPQNTLKTDLNDEGQNDDVKMDWNGLQKFYNDNMAHCAISPIKVMTTKRKGNINARVREYGKQAIADVIINASKSDFLNGHNKRNWVATFDWLFLPTNFPKVLEGNYENKTITNNIENGNANGYQYISREEQREREREQRFKEAAELIQKFERENNEPKKPICKFTMSDE